MPKTVEEQIQEFTLAVLAAEKARLEADLVEALRLQDFEKIDRLHVVSVAKPWGATREFWHGLQSPNYRSFEVIVADEVGWAASFVEERPAGKVETPCAAPIPSGEVRGNNWPASEKPIYVSAPQATVGPDCGGVETPEAADERIDATLTRADGAVEAVTASVYTSEGRFGLRDFRTTADDAPVVLHPGDSLNLPVVEIDGVARWEGSPP